MYTSPFTLITRHPWGEIGIGMVELNDTQRMGLLIGAAAIVIFIIVNMTGMLTGGDKLFLIDLIGIGSKDAMRPVTGLSNQDFVGLAIAGVLGALYYMSAEEELDWEALLGDDDEEE